MWLLGHHMHKENHRRLHGSRVKPSSSTPAAGALVLIGTPIGNLGDLAPRAVEALAAADVICCEDTRRTGLLLQHAGVERRPLLTVNDHTEARVIGDVLARLARGDRVAVVSDAGMPGISDPGERLVRAAAADGHRVEVVPGPTAGITALVTSGLPTGRFVFEGFLPRKGSGRTTRLADLACERRGRWLTSPTCAAPTDASSSLVS